MGYWEGFKFTCHRCQRRLTRLEDGVTGIGDDNYCDTCIREIEDEVDWSECIYSSAFPERATKTVVVKLRKRNHITFK